MKLPPVCTSAEAPDGVSPKVTIGFCRFHCTSGTMQLLTHLPFVVQNTYKRASESASNASAIVRGRFSFFRRA
jgi:hypothetical protein